MMEHNIEEAIKATILTLTHQEHIQDLDLLNGHQLPDVTELIQMMNQHVTTTIKW